MQPLIAPLNGGKSTTASEVESPARGGRSALEVLALLTQFKNPAGGKVVASYLAAQSAAYEAVRKVLADRVNLEKDENANAAFDRYKQLGFLPLAKDKAARQAQKVEAKPAEVAKAIAAYQPATAPTKESLEVTFHPSYACTMAPSR